MAFSAVSESIVAYTKMYTQERGAKRTLIMLCSEHPWQVPLQLTRWTITTAKFTCRAKDMLVQEFVWENWEHWTYDVEAQITNLDVLQTRTCGLGVISVYSRSII